MKKYRIAFLVLVVFGLVCAAFFAFRPKVVDNCASCMEEFVQTEQAKCMKMLQEKVQGYDALLQKHNISLEEYCASMADWQYIFMTQRLEKCSDKEHCFARGLVVYYDNIENNYNDYMRE